MSTNISKRSGTICWTKSSRFVPLSPQHRRMRIRATCFPTCPNSKRCEREKYGLVFEEHREEIDEVLDTHTPVLTEDADLFIDHGVQMNFLIEGDNLASLQLLEKTHKGKLILYT